MNQWIMYNVCVLCYDDTIIKYRYDESKLCLRRIVTIHIIIIGIIYDRIGMIIFHILMSLRARKVSICDYTCYTYI